MYRFFLASLLLVPSLAAQQPLPSALGVVDASARLATLADQPAPSGLNARDQKTYKDQTVWLRGVGVRLDTAAAQIKAARAVGQGASGAAAAQPVSGAPIPDVDLLKKKIEEEARRFAALSGVLKARHEAAMNAIRNIRD